MSKRVIDEMGMSLAWEDDFPKGYGHTSIAYLKRCPGFAEAKNGDMDAAGFVVSKCAKQDRIQNLREHFPDAILLPILGRNKLPLALAQAIGLPIWGNVYLPKVVSRKFLCAMERLLHRPEFLGTIQKDLRYILVDDVIVQGGTIAALREHVMVQGGKVVAVAALAYTIGSHAVAPLKRHIVRLMVKFGAPVIMFLRMYGVAVVPRELTNSQAKYLLRFASLGNIAKRAEIRPVNIFDKPRYRGMITNPILSQNIKHYRKLHDMTQSELAAEIGVEPEHIANIECGRKGISLPKLVLLCKRFHISLSDIYPLDEQDDTELQKKLRSETIKALGKLDITQLSIVKTMVCSLVVE